MSMRVISVKRLKDFWAKHPSSRSQLEVWYAEVKKSKWRSPGDIIKRYKTASELKNNRVVFRIKGNEYRLVAAIRYDMQIVFVRFIGTHSEYDKINAEEI